MTANNHKQLLISELLDQKSAAEQDPFALATWAKSLGEVISLNDVGHLLPCLKHSDGRVRSNTIEGLHQVYQREPSPRLLQIFANFLTDPEPRVVTACIKAISSEVNATELRNLVDRVYNPLEPRRCLATLYLIRHLNLRSAVDMVDLMATNQDFRVQREAHKLLAEFAAQDELARQSAVEEARIQRLEQSLKNFTPDLESLQYLLDKGDFVSWCLNWDPLPEDKPLLIWLLQSQANNAVEPVKAVVKALRKLPGLTLEEFDEATEPLQSRQDLRLWLALLNDAMGGDKAFQLLLEILPGIDLADAEHKALLLKKAPYWYQKDHRAVENYCHQLAEGGREGVGTLAAIAHLLEKERFSSTIWELLFDCLKNCTDEPLFKLVAKALVSYSDDSNRQKLSEILQKLPEGRRQTLRLLLKNSEGRQEEIPSPIEPAPITPVAKPQPGPQATGTRPMLSKNVAVVVLALPALAAMALLFYSRDRNETVSNALFSTPTAASAASGIVLRYRGQVTQVLDKDLFRIRTSDGERVIQWDTKDGYLPKIGEDIRAYGEFDPQTEILTARGVFPVS